MAEGSCRATTVLEAVFHLLVTPLSVPSLLLDTHNSLTLAAVDSVTIPFLSNRPFLSLWQPKLHKENLKENQHLNSSSSQKGWLRPGFLEADAEGLSVHAGHRDGSCVC